MQKTMTHWHDARASGAPRKPQPRAYMKSQLEKAHQTLAMNATYIDGFTTPCV
jgi:hypothetical protein